jgi:2-methylcitrate dehydratase PrpD
MNNQGLSRKFARFIHGLTLNDLPPKVIDRAKDRILDALAIAVAGRDFPYYPIGFELVKNNRKGKATVFLHNLKLQAMDAAFLNAILIDTVGGTDTLMHAHPGGPIIATALALAEEEKRSGAEVITAIVAAYDIMARVALAKETITPRFRGLSIYGPFGAAAAAGKILRLDEDQLTYAIGYAANSSSGLTECWIAGTMEAKFHAGLASRNGITAAILARAGAKAAETVLEGKAGFYQAFGGTNEGLDAAWGDLGKRFMILEAKYKPYPVCAENQISVDLSLKLKEQHGIDAKNIDHIMEIGPLYAISYPGVDYPGPFQSRGQAIMSAQFCNAAAFLGKPVSSPSFFDHHYGDPEIGELAKKVKLSGEKNRKTTLLEVTLKDGKKYRLEGNEEELIPSFEKVKVKLQNLASGLLSKDKIDRVSDIVYKLDKAKTIHELMNELKG